jgi:double-stranded uracil-DNA glycosylase
VDERTRLLVLGSLPGEMSLARAQYYANPRNQFWALMSAVAETDLVPLAYEERLKALLSRRVGLWDVVESAERAGSLDTAIRGHTANDVGKLAARLPDLRAVAFNGGKSAAIGGKAPLPPHVQLVALPSSSPAYTLSFEAKRAAWLELRHFL